MKRSLVCGIALAMALMILAPVLSHAQWVTIGRKSMGAIQNLRSEHSDVATVLLEAPADKVYAAALRTLSEKQGVKIKDKDDATRTIDFSGKHLTAKMMVSPVDAQVSILTITAPGTVITSGDASPVVAGVLRVCREANVECHETKN